MYEKIKGAHGPRARLQKSFSINRMPMQGFNDDQLSAFFRGELGKSDIQKLRNKAAQNPELATELKRQQMILDHIELLEDRNIAARVRKVHHQEMKRRSTFSRLKRYRIMAVAAVILLLLSAGWWIWQPTSTPDELFADNYVAYSLELGSRGEGDLLLEAGNEYKNQNYNSAKPLFEKLLEEDSNFSKVRLALGICEMELENWEKAATHFELLINENGVLFADKAHWYLALTQLKIGKIVEAKNNLEVIKSNKKAHFREKAAELLDQL